MLTEHGKTKNPWPNVDAHSGVLLQVREISHVMKDLTVGGVLPCSIMG